MNFTFNDGGRSKYFKGKNADDCVVRAIAIAAKKDYKEVYDALKTRMGKGKSPRNGIHKKIYHEYIISLGFKWEPYMGIGTGCTIIMNKQDLPVGTYICRLSKHLSCISNYTIFDTFDPSREGMRCVYGIYKRVPQRKRGNKDV